MVPYKQGKVVSLPPSLTWDCPVCTSFPHFQTEQAGAETAQIRLEIHLCLNRLYKATCLFQNEDEIPRKGAG